MKRETLSGLPNKNEFSPRGEREFVMSWDCFAAPLNSINLFLSFFLGGGGWLQSCSFTLPEQTCSPKEFLSLNSRTLLCILQKNLMTLAHAHASR